MNPFRSRSVLTPIAPATALVLAACGGSTPSPSPAPVPLASPVVRPGYQIACCGAGEFGTAIRFADWSLPGHLAQGAGVAAAPFRVDPVVVVVLPRGERLVPPPFPETIGALNERVEAITPYPSRSTGQMFLRGWATIAGFEVALLTVTALMPSSLTGWSFDRGFIKSGMEHFGEAWTQPPVWDTDHWFHNYIGHPYGGNLYYNTLRSQGGDKFHSFLFSGAMSMWWEYIFEAMAERPSIQDIIITPVAGSLLGELVHRTTVAMRRNGTSPFEKAFILVFNPTHLFMSGWNGPWTPP